MFFQRSICHCLVEESSLSLVELLEGTRPQGSPDDKRDHSIAPYSSTRSLKKGQSSSLKQSLLPSAKTLRCPLISVARPRAAPNDPRGHRPLMAKNVDAGPCGAPITFMQLEAGGQYRGIEGIDGISAAKRSTVIGEESAHACGCNSTGQMAGLPPQGPMRDRCQLPLM